MNLTHRLRPLRPTIRLRLTLLYAALFLVTGAALLAVTYVLVSRATSEPRVFRDSNGGLGVTFSGSIIGGKDPAPGDLQPNATGGPSGPAVPQGVPTADQIQALTEQQHAAEMNQLLAWSGVSLALMAVVSVGIGWRVAGRALAPVRTLTADVRRVSSASLGHRVRLDGPDDELKELGVTFNDLLARLEQAFEAQRRFVANASHELRTPLARQRTMIEVALDDSDASVESLRATFQRALAASAQQEQLIDALITLARGERGLDRREPVDLATVADAVIGGREADVRAKGLRIERHLDGSMTMGDPRLLERLVANLVDNAARYNRPRGLIEVTTETRDGGALLRVVNDGPILRPDQLGRLFEPFQRLAGDRMARSDGWGLGLSIVRAIALAHDGQVTATPRPDGGLVVEALLPARHSIASP